MNTNNAIIPADVNATEPTTTDVVEPAAAPRKPRGARKPAKTADSTVDVKIPTSIADVYRVAKTITGANIVDVLAGVNAGFAVNAPGKNVGRFTHQRIVHFQNGTLLENATRKLTDVQLLAVWRMEFPSATGAVFAADWKTGVRIVRGVRAHVNRSGHGEPERFPAGFKSESYS